MDDRLARRRERRERRGRRRRALVAAALVIVAAVCIGLAIAFDVGSPSRTESARPADTFATSRPGNQEITTIVGSRANEQSQPPDKSAASSLRGRREVHLGRAPRPRIVQKPIPFTARRRSEMAAYAKRHYGINSWRLSHPRVIVEHYTASDSFASAYNTFASDSPDGELGELPGVCSHFVINKDGSIYQLVATTIMCRHTVGLNYTAIGIEHVGMSDQEILENPRQLRASLALSVWLMQQKRIVLRNVIGHNESLASPFHRELYKPWRCQTHGDWSRADMDIYRAKLARVARGYNIPLGPARKVVIPQC
jgi:N-acetylmuramoyl-L-alanine amidase